MLYIGKNLFLKERFGVGNHFVVIKNVRPKNKFIYFLRLTNELYIYLISLSLLVFGHITFSPLIQENSGLQRQLDDLQEKRRKEADKFDSEVGEE